MQKFVTAAVVAAGLSTAIGLAAPSQAAPTTTGTAQQTICLLYTSPSPRDRQKSRMPSSA